ncbi:DEAD/DEAH box helicase family protein [Gemella morbillorum]|uniref:DEAD/DEAH box helicase n=1 Tax=Gemella morbillorum TaxID=29391 RepID=UPI0028D83456|nr:DEAD/DEAH box helicase family protein [Gemella morbillorum]
MENLENGLFFNSLFKKDSKVEKLINDIKLFIKQNTTQVYLLDKVLGIKSKFNYDLNDVIYVIIPNYPILLLFDDKYNEEQIEDYFHDLKEDIGQLSAKYNYNYILDRPRKWNENWFKLRQWSEFTFENYIENEKIDNLDDVRRIELIISLITGSINDINKIGKDTPDNLLDKVKKQIMLLDGKQSHFIYGKDNQDKVLIQGMAGTGKTELLMRKIKELYVSEENSRIAFTCHNRVLANDMKGRIEKFFNFMKVEEQIDWETRLKVFNAWGSKYGENKGMYSYICESYNIQFLNLGEAKNFDSACKQAIKQLNEIENLENLFDYIFIDESQDFSQSFFDLCKLVCKNTVYIAGDIFQSIFDETKKSDLEADYMLEKCYRTDPRTLMFAHSIGLGLFENPPLNWLTDMEWEACGYKVIRENNFKLTREPLRRFEDIQSTNSIVVEEYKTDKLYKSVLNKIFDMKKDNPTMEPEDLGIIIIDNDYNNMMKFSYNLKKELMLNLEWNSTIGVETKHKESNSVYISNENNVKGLEFPFVIVILLMDIGNSIKLRNSLYMSLTRSFIRSYLIIDSYDVQKTFIDIYIQAASSIIEHDCLELNEPTEEQIKNMKYKITMQRRQEKDIRSKVEELLKQKKYVRISRKDNDFIMNKVNGEWSTLSETEILSKVSNLADSLL